MIWIIDASVAVQWFIVKEAHTHADEVLEKVIDSPEKFAVPELFSVEVFSILQRIHPSGFDAFRKGIIPLFQGGILRQPMTEDLALIADRFVKLGLISYDACYAALARDLKEMWITFDEQGHRLLQKEKIPFFLDETMPPSWIG